MGASDCAYCGNETLAVDSNGMPVCHECSAKLATRREKKGIAPARRRHCFEDGTVLEREVVNGIAIERCPRCKSVWLSQGELDALRRAALAAQGAGPAEGLHFLFGFLAGKVS